MEINSIPRLSKNFIKNKKQTISAIPADNLLQLPEKVLQFGTGVLLRGLPDYFIDKANRKGIFNGRIVVVKSTDSGDFDVFAKQDSLYTICIRGVEDGNNIEENIVCSAISRVLSAKNQWKEILACASNPEMQIVISNTTEIGIELVQDDIKQSPPVSYPGKLLAFLYERYKAFKGSTDKGMVIVPTELIVGNGEKLASIVLELAHRNGLEEGFIEWLENSNQFCNTLVDRILPGLPDAATKLKTEKLLGYKDELITFSEVYRLWAIEGDEHIKSVLSFMKADAGVIVESNIDLYRELKLRLLNGTHTLSCGLAFLAGNTTVKEGMKNQDLFSFIKTLMLDEIAPNIPYEIKEQTIRDFGLSTLERFQNPHIAHNWISITAQYTSKMRMRNIPILLHYYKTIKQVPEYFAFGFAGYLLFMKVVQKDGNNYKGENKGQLYPINDNKAEYFYEKWKSLAPEALVIEVLKDKSLWEHDLTRLPGFAPRVTECLKSMIENGVQNTLHSFLKKNHERKSFKNTSQ